jgi:phosphoribosylaminoimidazolecarboxamide formyltransferase / IMP cyclohydrolase
MLHGRVKTLHPAVHGGLLARRDDPEHMAAIAEHGIEPIDLVCVNLYPFRETIARRDVTPDMAIEQIDIGGPSMLRSAAKNHASVFVIVDPADYERVISALKADDDDQDDCDACSPARCSRTLPATTLPLRVVRSAARGALSGAAHTLARAHAVAALRREPGQRAAFYAESRGAGLAGLRQLGGKELSFNNLLDLEGALLATDPFADEPRAQSSSTPRPAARRG